jgi:hypothetical protein
MFAIQKGFQLAKQFSMDSILKNIWIFSDSQAALKRLQKLKISGGQLKLEIILKCATAISKRDINIHLHWVPAHIGIKGNEIADKAAKKGTELNQLSEKKVTWSYLKRKVRENCLDQWERYWERNRTRNHYFQFETLSKWKSIEHSKGLEKQLISTINQLKLGHGYFRSYLSKFTRNYNSNKCPLCHTVENPEHLLLFCSENIDLRLKIKSKYQLEQLNLKFLFQTEAGFKFLKDFLRNSKIATRKWLVEVE